MLLCNAVIVCSLNKQRVALVQMSVCTVSFLQKKLCYMIKCQGSHTSWKRLERNGKYPVKENIWKNSKMSLRKSYLGKIGMNETEDVQ